MTYAASYFTSASDQFTNKGLVKDTANTGTEVSGLGNTRVTQPGRVAKYNGSSDYTHLYYIPVIGSGNWTLAGWARLDDLAGSSQTLFSQHSPTTAYGVSLRVTSDGKVRFRIIKSTGTTEIECDNAITAEAWHFVVVTRNGDDYRLYVDGIAQGTSATTVSGTIPYEISYLAARRDENSNFVEYLKGRLWCWCSWNSVLTEKEIAELFLEPTAIAATGSLKRCYKLEEKTGNLAYNSGAYENNGQDKLHGAHISSSISGYEDGSVPASFANEVGYTDNDTIIGRRERANYTNEDASGGSLEFTGSMPRHAKIASVNALECKNGAYVDVGAISGAPTGDAARTIAFWVRPDSVSSGTDKPVFQYQHSGGSGQRMIIYAEDDGFSVGINGKRVGATVSGFGVGKWYHVAVVVPETASDFTYAADLIIYVNDTPYSKSLGNLWESIPGDGPELNTNSPVDIRFASDESNPSNYGDCAMSDVRVYSSDMSTYITEIMRGEIPVVANLVAAWPLAEGAGETAYDIRGPQRGDHMNNPSWVTGDGIPSHNLRFGHMKVLHIVNNNEFVETPIEFLLDAYASWEFECEFKIDGTLSGNTLFSIAGEADTGVQVNSDGTVDVRLGDDQNGVSAVLGAETGIVADSWHTIKVTFNGESYQLGSSNLRVHPNIAISTKVGNGAWNVLAAIDVTAPETLRGILRFGSNYSRSAPENQGWR